MSNEPHLHESHLCVEAATWTQDKNRMPWDPLYTTTKSPGARKKWRKHSTAKRCDTVRPTRTQGAIGGHVCSKHTNPFAANTSNNEPRRVPQMAVSVSFAVNGKEEERVAILPPRHPCVILCVPGLVTGDPGDERPGSVQVPAEAEPRQAVAQLRGMRRGR